jgi:zinc protease
MVQSLHSAAALVIILTSALAAQGPRNGGQGSRNGGDVLAFDATETTLPNGLKVIIVPTGFPNLVSLRISVQAGSRNEVEPGKSGFAHFFEHLMFRGTPQTPPARFREITARAGARDNASTGDDFTQYYATFAKEDLDRIIGLYADMFQHLQYSEADFKTEARAILGEYNKNSAEPLEKLFEVQRDRFYRTHTYRHTTMGFIADIENMPNEFAYSRLFFERWYRPELTTVVIAGDVAPAQALSVVRKHWGGWQIGTRSEVEVPRENATQGPHYVHVPWTSDTLPLVTVGFLGPAFDENTTDSAAMAIIAALYFGRTSDLYKRLVVAEQKVDELDVDIPTGIDPSLFTIVARVKSPSDVEYVRDQILQSAARARAFPVDRDRLTDALSFSRYSFARTLDSTERIAAVVGRYAAYRRSYQTVNAYYRTLSALTPADIHAAARRYLTDAGLIVATLSREPLAPGIVTTPKLDQIEVGSLSEETRAASASPASDRPSDRPSAAAKRTTTIVLQPSKQPQLLVKLLFGVGSAHDPAGKEGLAALTADLIANGGSAAMRIDEIEAARYPLAGSFRAVTDKEMTTFTGTIHRERWQRFLELTLPQLVDPGWREEDFRRVKERQLNELVQDLRANNEEELGKERLQTNIFRGTPYGHVALGTVAGINAVTLEDVKGFARTMFTRANLTLGASGDVPDAMLRELQARLDALPAGLPVTRPSIDPARLEGIDVEIVEKETRATAISFGFPIAVTRSHPDYAALSVARAWLGEHRASSGRLFQQIREVRGFNYGDYAYIEAFPRGMFQFFPDANIARQRQIFEIWIRPVVPVNAHMALRIAVAELEALVRNGLTQTQFDDTREYLMKNVFVMTARQDQQLGYALDSRWYGTGEFTETLRERLRRLNLRDVNSAIKRHLDAQNLSIVIITKDAAGLRDALVSDVFSPVTYDGDKPASLREEDRRIGALKLGIDRARVRVTPVADVFAR